jgi:hypothetical protein
VLLVGYVIGYFKGFDAGRISVRRWRDGGVS